MIIADAPSVICDALPAVMSGAGWSSETHAGASAASASSEALRRIPSSASSTVPVSARLGVLDRHRDDLAREEAVVGVLGGALVRLQRVRVHLLARDAPLVGEHLRDPELDAERVVGVGEELAD